MMRVSGYGSIYCAPTSSLPGVICLKHKVVTSAAILSLALAMGACGAACRLVNALFIRPLPIANPSQLFAVRFDGVTFQGEPAHWDSTSYVHLMNMRAAVRGQAEVIGVQYAQRDMI